jgi:hypothetical protein
LGVDERDRLVTLKGLASPIEVTASQMAKGAAEVAEEGAILGSGNDTLIGDLDGEIGLLPQEEAERDSAGDGVGVRIVVGQDQDSGCVLDRVYERCETLFHGLGLRFGFRSIRRPADQVQGQQRYYTGRRPNVPVRWQALIKEQPDRGIGLFDTWAG